MARIKTPFPISGPLGDVVFADYGKHTVARMRPSSNKKKRSKHHRYQRCRENAQTFGGASKTACAIYSTMARGQKHLFLPYSHNKLIRRLMAHARPEFNPEIETTNPETTADQTQPTPSRAVERYTFKHALPALRNIDLSHEEAPKNRIKLQPLGPVHNPDSLRISGFQEAAEVMHLNGNGRLETRIQLHYIRYPEARYDKKNKEWTIAHGHNHRAAPPFKSEWIPVQILPEEGLLLNLHQPEDDTQPILTFAIIEWREVRNVEDEIKPMHEEAVARIAAMHYSEELALEIAMEQLENQKPHPSKPQAPDWQMDPNAYLEFALKGIIKKPKETLPPG